MHSWFSPYVTNFSGIWTLARKMTSFRFSKKFCALGLGLRLDLGIGLG